MEEIQMDFFDPGLPQDPSGEGKKQHGASVLNFVDAGTSVLLEANVHAEYHSQTADGGRSLTSRAPMDVPFASPLTMIPAGWEGQADGIFPRRCGAIGVSHRGRSAGLSATSTRGANGYVERYHRTYKYECIEVHHPQTVEDLRRVTEEFEQHYNIQRPHQGRACGNQPPRVAFPELPKLPPLPETVQADRRASFVPIIGSWLVKWARNGCVTVNTDTYYISTKLAGQKVALVIDAPNASFDVMLGEKVEKSISIKGVIRGEMLIEKFITLLLEQARSEERERTERKARGLSEKSLGPHSLTSKAEDREQKVPLIRMGIPPGSLFCCLFPVLPLHFAQKLAQTSPEKSFLSCSKLCNSSF